MSDPQPPANPPAPNPPPRNPPADATSAAPAAGQPAAKGPMLRLLESIPEPGWRDGVWMSSSHFAVAGDEGVWAYDVTQPEPRRGQLGTSGDVTALAYIPAARSLVLGDREGQVHSIELGSGRAGFHLGVNRTAVVQLSADPAGRWVGSASETDVAVVNLATRAEWRLAEQSRAVAWLGDGVFATIGDQAVEVWFCETRGRVATLAANAAQAVALEYLAAPGMLAAGFRNGEVGFWTMMDDPPAARGVLHIPGGLDALAVAPDGKTIATGSADGIRLWNDFSPEPPPATDAGAAIQALRFAPDGRRLAAVTADGISIFAIES